MLRPVWARRRLCTLLDPNASTEDFVMEGGTNQVNRP